MRYDGDCSKCNEASICGVDRTRMCAEMRFDLVKQEDEIMREDRRAEHSEEI